MGFAEAWINIQIVHQVIFDMPWYYDIKTNTLIVNPKHRLKLIQRIKQMPIWTLYNLTAIVGFLSSTLQLFFNLFSVNIKTQEIHNQQIFSQGVIFVITLLVIVTTYSANESHIKVLSNALQIAGINNVGIPTTERLPDMTELMGYGLVFMFFSFPVVAIAGPFLMSSDFFTEYLTDIIPEFYQRSLAAIIYGSFTFVGANVLGNFLIIEVAGCQIFEKQAEQNLHLSKGIIKQNRQGSS